MRNLFFLIFTIVILHPSQGQQTETEDDSSIEKNIDRLCLSLIEQANLPGIAIAVNHQGTLVFEEAYGYADVESKEALKTSSTLRTASVAKIITATALAKLVSDGKLDLDLPIKEYISYVPKKLANLTSRQLAAHTSGLPHRPKRSKIKNLFYESTEDRVNLLSNLSLSFEPDSEFSYSTNGFNLLAAVIEGASKQSYLSYLQEVIFEPLGMKHTYPENSFDLREDAASLYSIKDGELVKEKKLVNGSYKLAGAGFRSTPSDLVLMMNAYSNGFIKSEVVNDFFKEHLLKNGDATRLGVGWNLNYDMFKRETIEHAGNWQGARTVVVYYPKEQLSISIMINAKCTIFIEETAHIIAQYFLSQNSEKLAIEPYENIPINVSNNRPDGSVETYKGLFNLDSNFTGSIEAKTDVSFLKNMKIFGLNQKNSYVAVNQYGLFYLEIDLENKILGDLYMYQKRNPIPPTEKKASFHFEN